MTDAAVRSFVAKQRDWLLKELQCENETLSSATEEGRSLVLQQLEAVDVSVGLYGRTVVALEAISSSSQTPSLLPAHRFTTGDEVEIRSKSAASSSRKNPSGVISLVTENRISVSLFDGIESDSEHLAPPLSMLPKSSIEIHKKLMHALDELEKNGTNHPMAGGVVQAAFDRCSLSFSIPSSNATERPADSCRTSSTVVNHRHGKSNEDGELELKASIVQKYGPSDFSTGPTSGRTKNRPYSDEFDRDLLSHIGSLSIQRPSEAKIEQAPGSFRSVVDHHIAPFSDKLNDSQVDAISFALMESHPVTLIHGPPGTG